MNLKYIHKLEKIFQSTLLREERQLFEAPSRLATQIFNPRSYARSDIKIPLVRQLIANFQSTLLREERPKLAFRFSASLIFQSTLLREERRPICYFNGACICIFNPRSYARSDDRMIDRQIRCLIFSIHAPTRGATNPTFSASLSISFFNPRSYARSDRIF